MSGSGFFGLAKNPVGPSGFGFRAWPEHITKLGETGLSGSRGCIPHPIISVRLLRLLRALEQLDEVGVDVPPQDRPRGDEAGHHGPADAAGEDVLPGEEEPLHVGLGAQAGDVPGAEALAVVVQAVDLAARLVQVVVVGAGGADLRGIEII